LHVSVSGANHGEELEFVFGVPLYGSFPWKANVSYTDEEVTLAKAVMTLWTNFATTG